MNTEILHIAICELGQCGASRRAAAFSDHRNAENELLEIGKELIQIRSESDPSDTAGTHMGLAIKDACLQFSLATERRERTSFDSVIIILIGSPTYPIDVVDWTGADPVVAIGDP